MGEARLNSKRRKERQKELLAKHPLCYFCGGHNPSNTIDHVPPESCFPKGYHPEDFEFPACDACNQGGKKHDSIFGAYSIMLDFDEKKFDSKDDQRKLRHALQGVKDYYPDAMPDFATGRDIYRTCHIYTSRPVGHLLKATPAMQEATEFMEEKLTHALYLREVKTIMTPDHRFTAGFYQPQLDGTGELTNYFRNLLPNTTVGTRPNIKEYGDRFKYIFGYKDAEDFFVYAAQFGKGCIIWGIVCGPAMPDPSVGPGKKMKPKAGGCGPGRVP